jgi:hypothetical protein
VYIDARVSDSKGNKTSIGKTYVSNYSEAAVDRACGHAGSRGRHRFRYVLPNGIKAVYTNKRVTAKVRKTGDAL